MAVMAGRDAVTKQLMHVFVTPPVLRAGHVCVGQLMNDGELRRAADHRFQVHLFEDDAPVWGHCPLVVSRNSTTHLAAIPPRPLRSSPEVLQFAPADNAERFQGIVSLFERDSPQLFGGNVVTAVPHDQSIGDSCCRADKARSLVVGLNYSRRRRPQCQGASRSFFVTRKKIFLTFRREWTYFAAASIECS